MLRRSTTASLSLAFRLSAALSPAVAAPLASTSYRNVSTLPLASCSPRHSTLRLFPPSSRLLSSTPSTSDSAPAHTITPLSDSVYHTLSNAVLESLSEQFESFIEESDLPALETRALREKLGPQRGAPTSEWDVECATGVMNLRLGPYGTYVINKQPPNKQIWLSSPISGPKRFDYDSTHRTWFSFKDDQLVTLKGLLDAELAVVFDTDVDLYLDRDQQP